MVTMAPWVVGRSRGPAVGGGNGGGEPANALSNPSWIAAELTVLYATLLGESLVCGAASPRPVEGAPGAGLPQAVLSHTLPTSRGTGPFGREQPTPLDL